MKPPPAFVIKCPACDEPLSLVTRFEYPNKCTINVSIEQESVDALLAHVREHTYALDAE